MGEGTTNRADLAEQICQQIGVPSKDAESLVLSIISLIEEALLSGETVKLAGFGVFSIVERQEMLGRNIKAGSTVVIPKRHVVIFKPSNKLKTRVEAGAADRLRLTELQLSPLFDVV